MAPSQTKETHDASVGSSNDLFYQQNLLFAKQLLNIQLSTLILFLSNTTTIYQSKTVLEQKRTFSYVNKNKYQRYQICAKNMSDRNRKLRHNQAQC